MTGGNHLRGSGVFPVKIYILPTTIRVLAVSSWRRADRSTQEVLLAKTLNEQQEEWQTVYRIFASVFIANKSHRRRWHNVIYYFDDILCAHACSIVMIWPTGRRTNSFMNNHRPTNITLWTCQIDRSGNAPVVDVISYCTLNTTTNEWLTTYLKCGSKVCNCIIETSAPSKLKTIKYTHRGLNTGDEHIYIYMYIIQIYRLLPSVILLNTIVNCHERRWL